MEQPFILLHDPLLPVARPLPDWGIALPGSAALRRAMSETMFFVHRLRAF